MSVHCSSKLSSKISFYSHLTLKKKKKYIYIYIYIFFYFFFPLPDFSHSSLSQFKLSPLTHIPQTHTSAIDSSSSHRRHQSSPLPIHHPSPFPFFSFFFNSSSAQLPCPTPLTHANPSCPCCQPKSQAPSRKLTHADPSRPLRPISTSLLCLGNQFLQSLLVDLLVSCLCLLHHVMLRVFDLGDWNDKFFMSVGNFLFAGNLYLLILIRHGKTSQNFLTRLDPNPIFFTRSKNGLTRDPT